MNDQEFSKAVDDCAGSHYTPGKPRCFISSDDNFNVPWIKENDVFYWWEMKSGMSLNIPGVGTVPLWNRHILCPAHVRIALDGGLIAAVPTDVT